MKNLQKNIFNWLIKCFGSEIAYDKTERNYRFLEEALELVQACGCTKQESHDLVDYVFSRPKGEKSQEVGGVVITLSALCSAHSLDIKECGNIEFKRVNNKKTIERIQEKHRNKPKYVKNIY